MAQEKLRILEERMKKQLTSEKDVTIFSLLLETLMDIRVAFEEFNSLFEIDINLDELESFQMREIDYSGEWCNSLIKICEVLITLYEKIGKPDLASKWKEKLTKLHECREENS